MPFILFPNVSVLVFFFLFFFSPTIFIDLKSFSHNHYLARVDWFPHTLVTLKALFYLLQCQNILPYVHASLSNISLPSSLQQNFPSLFAWAPPPPPAVPVGVIPEEMLENTSLGKCLPWTLQKTVGDAWKPLHQEIQNCVLLSVGEWGKAILLGFTCISSFTRICSMSHCESPLSQN